MNLRNSHQGYFENLCQVSAFAFDQDDKNMHDTLVHAFAEMGIFHSPVEIRTHIRKSKVHGTEWEKRLQLAGYLAELPQRIGKSGVRGIQAAPKRVEYSFTNIQSIYRDIGGWFSIPSDGRFDYYIRPCDIQNKQIRM